MLQVPGRQPDQTVVRYPRTTAHVQQLQLCTTLQNSLHKIIANRSREGGDRQLFQFWEARGIHLQVNGGGLVGHSLTLKITIFCSPAPEASPCPK